MTKKYFYQKAKIFRRTVSVLFVLILCIMSSSTAFAGSFTNPDSTNSNYYRWGAKVYAEKYAPWPGSSKYKNFATVGGDCTNFASQVLNEGGRLSEQGYPNKTANSSFYYNNNTTYSNSWVLVASLMRHLANYNGSGYQRAYSFRSYSISAAATTSYYTIYKDLYEGDLIQYTGGIEHSQVVHKYNSTDLYMAQHGTTSDRFWSGVTLKTYLNWVIDQYGTNVTVYTIRMKKAVT